MMRFMVSTNPSRTEETKSSTSDSLPYVVRRGDGSTGGGGLPMPHSKQQQEDRDEKDNSDLVRPKVSSFYLSR